MLLRCTRLWLIQFAVAVAGEAVLLSSCRLPSNYMKAFANGIVAIQSKTRMARKSTQLYFRSFSRLALSVRHLAPTHLSSPSASPRHFSHSHKPVEEPKTSAQRGTILDVGKTFEVQSPRLVLFVRQPLTRAAGSCAQSAAQASDWLLFTFFHGGRYHDGDVSGIAKAVR